MTKPDGGLTARGRRAPAAGDAPTPGWDPRELLAIALGGAVGALLRAGLSEAFAGGAPSWPWVTFSVNLAGAFALGWFITRLQERLPLSTYRRPLLGTGFCGALTTFSTGQVELLRMLDAHSYGLASGYLLASVACGFAAVHLATGLVRWRPGMRS
jgi:CrcB protein